MSTNPSLVTKPAKRRPIRRRKNTKITGERSEADFLARAYHLGFGVAKPWGDSRRYDFILDNGECLHRIQVKCTEAIRAGAYETRATYTTGKGRAVYTKDDIDFIAAHVVPLNLWYIVPVEVCTPAPMLRFYPHRQARRMRLEPYREAWHLILPKQSNDVMEIHACADDNIYPDDADTDHVDNDPVGTDAFVRPPSEARAADLDRQFRRLIRAAYRKAPVVQLDPSLAPWRIPPLKILVHREGKHILPLPPKE